LISNTKVNNLASEVSLYEQDTVLLRLAREIAIDLFPIETILANNKIDQTQFERIKTDPRFLKLVESEVMAWNAAANTHERTKLKAGALIEEFLPEAHGRLHDGKEPLSAKTELLKALARIANMGNERGQGEAGAGERFTVTINLGADQKLEFSKSVTPKVTQVIEGTVNPAE
jgi:hypothetical protein